MGQIVGLVGRILVDDDGLVNLFLQDFIGGMSRRNVAGGATGFFLSDESFVDFFAGPDPYDVMSAKENGGEIYHFYCG